MDENNTSIDGDFNGQLANGNITNTFNYPGRERLSPAEVRPIKLKGKKLIELTGKESVEIWGKLKEIFGEGHNDLFKDQEKPAHAVLDLWLEKTELEVANFEIEQTHAETSRQLIASMTKNGELNQKIAILRSDAEQKLKQPAPNGRNASGQDTLSELKKTINEKATLQETLVAERQRSDKQIKYAEARIERFASDFNASQRALKITRAGLIFLALTSLLLGMLTAWFYQGYRQLQSNLAVSTAFNQQCPLEQKYYVVGQSVSLKNGLNLECRASQMKASWALAKPAKPPLKKKPRDTWDEEEL
ncbi:hypothetical protein Undi14_11775 [Undibacterium sp. 14-3-2]|uniref:hypothetical protein n=1 Tax=Undibacterium sp. 14-3-2 TaxID=2800129 RepID=UPI001906C68E|nr:hypothetical protein [Undibacterium sp. 14-3-2]MBK1890712.1 hypothetical protein [Undibacterium sp. 14-3-2]